MRFLAFLMSAAVFMAIRGASAELAKPEGNRLSIAAGEHRLADGRAVTVKSPTTLPIEPAGATQITDEPHVLKTEKPDRWITGTSLDALRAGGTPLPGCLVPGSVVVKLPDGSVAARDKDYLLDETWATLGRIDGGKIAADMQVKVSYRVGLMRLDTIEVDGGGNVALRVGKPEMTCAKPPPRTAGWTAWANVFMPYHATAIAPWQIYEIDGPFPEPDAAEIARRAALVPKTLAKLRGGQPVTIVTWGDSVTAGGDASSKDKAFAQLFPARLGERFPGSKITAHNAGIGATNSEQRLPALQKEVLDFKPDLVTIEFVNDMGMPDDAVRKRYIEIFKQIGAAGAEVIVITPHFTMPPWMGHEHPRGKETRSTVEVLRKLTAEEKVALADTSRRWEHLAVEGLPYTTLLVNGINHPDDRGHELFVNDLLTFFPKD